MSNERLTEKTKDCFGYRLKDGSDAEVGFFKDYDAFFSHMMTVKALGEYEDLEEQNLLLRLPCKIGDKVYAITRDFVSEYTICNIEVYNEGFFFNWRCEKGIYINIRGFTHYQIGVDIFLTQSEAEEKLRELEGK